jgi:uncharacterized membrane protein
MMNSWLIPALISATLSAIAAVMQKSLLRQLDEVYFSFLLSVAILAVSLPTLFMVDVVAVTGTSLLLLCLKGVINAFAFVAVMGALKKNEISATLPLLGLSPGVTALLAFVIIGETIMPSEIMGLVLMMAGVMTIEGWRQWQHAGGWKAAWAGSKQIVLALLLFALSSVVDKILVTSQRTDPYVVLFYQHVIFVLVFGAYLYVRRGASWTSSAGGVGQLVAGILVVALLTLGYRYFQLVASKQGSVAMVLAVKRTSVFWGALAGGYLFKEGALRSRLVGAALIIGAGFLILRVGG